MKAIAWGLPAAFLLFAVSFVMAVPDLAVWVKLIAGPVGFAAMAACVVKAIDA